MSNLVQHAKSELEYVGLFDNDADYGGALGHAIMGLIEKFSEQGHSGSSAALTIAYFTKLASFEPLGDITNNPDEWINVHEEMGEPHYQNRRRGTSFSRDGGQTWYDIEDASRNNGDTWFSQERTRELLLDYGLTGDEDIVLDLPTKSRLWDEIYELQRPYRDEHGLDHDGSIIIDREWNRQLRKEREHGEETNTEG